MSVEATSSSANIALIKYIGKRPWGQSKGGSHPIKKTSSVDPSSGQMEEALSSAFSPAFSPVFSPVFSSAFSPRLKNLSLRLSLKDREQLEFNNQALSPSLSITLDHLLTKVKIESLEGGARRDQWRPFEKSPFDGLPPLFRLSKKIVWERGFSSLAQKRYLDFFKLLKRFFALPGHYILYSENNFPSAAGMASSSSSFSALTLATWALAKKLSPFKKELALLSKSELAYLSRVGSGSSGRSFFSPFCLWMDGEFKGSENALLRNHLLQSSSPFKNPFGKWSHQAILIDLEAKQISSSEAHSLVKSSPRFKSHHQRSEKRLLSLAKAFRQKDWKALFKLCREEFLELHSLFETASPPFSYRNKHTEEALRQIESFWKKRGDGPLITMDAGANLHLFYRPDQGREKEALESALSDFPVLSSLA